MFAIHHQVITGQTATAVFCACLLTVLLFSYSLLFISLLSFLCQNAINYGHYSKCLGNNDFA